MHNLTTLNLPSLNSRAAARQEIEKDVAAFLAAGGKISRVGQLNSLDQPPVFRVSSSRAAGLADVRRPEGKRRPFDETKGVCCVCGCTWTCACEGRCHWVAPNLCSSCIPLRPERNGSRLRRFIWTPSREVLVKRRFSTVMPVPELAGLLGVTAATVYLKAKELGLQRLGRPE